MAEEISELPAIGPVPPVIKTPAINPNNREPDRTPKTEVKPKPKDPGLNNSSLDTGSPGTYEPSLDGKSITKTSYRPPSK